MNEKIIKMIINVIIVKEQIQQDQMIIRIHSERKIFIFYFFHFLFLKQILFRLNINAKVYVGNVPTENLTDRELLEFFKPFGKISGFLI